MMKHSLRSISCPRLVQLLMLGSLLLNGYCLLAAPTLLSSVPAFMATGISPTAPVVLTFSEAMNTNVTTGMFVAGTSLLTNTLVSWSDGDKVLTFSPVPSWPANQMITWMVVDGESLDGTLLEGDAFGIFTTAAASTGCDPNASMLSFTTSKGAMYSQTSAGAPVLSSTTPYCFLGCMTLPCPQNATNVTLQWSTSPGPQNMALSPIAGHLTLQNCGFATLAALDAAYPPGDYTFTIQSTSGSQPTTVNFPPTLTQPPAPHLTNYLAAQSVNPAQPFSLGWDPLPGGSAADCISVEIYGGVYQTPTIGMAGALNGTATAVVFPAGTFQPNSHYSGCVTFYHYQMITNGTAHIDLAYRASITEFDLATGAASTYQPTLSSPGWAGAGKFRFEVACPINQALVAEWRTNLQTGQWQTLATTNATTSRVQFTDPNAATHTRMFYRVRTGP
jgi:hypothetical protein